MAEVINTYKQRLPATRFIGKMYRNEDRVNGLFSARWGDWFQNGWFDEIEKTPGYNAAFYEDTNAYIGMMRYKDGEPFQYWIGMFTPAGTTVPEGFVFFDLPASMLGVCWIHGSEPDVYGKDDLVMEAFREKNIVPVTDADGAFWFFERYGCPRFTTPDEDGYIILDHCYFIAD